MNKIIYMTSKSKLIKFVKSQNPPKHIMDDAIGLIEDEVLKEQWQVSKFLNDPDYRKKALSKGEVNQRIGQVDERLKKMDLVRQGKCPKCGGKLRFEGNYYRCNWCGGYVGGDGSYVDMPKGDYVGLANTNFFKSFFVVLIFIAILIIVLLYFVLSYVIWHSFDLTLFAVMMAILIISLLCVLNGLKNG